MPLMAPQVLIRDYRLRMIRNHQHSLTLETHIPAPSHKPTIESLVLTPFSLCGSFCPILGISVQFQDTPAFMRSSRMCARVDRLSVIIR